MACIRPCRLLRRFVYLSLSVLIAGWYLPAARAATPCLKGEWCRTVVPVAGPVGIPVYALWPVGAPSALIGRLVFVIHGRRRNAGSYFRRMVRAAGKARAVETTQVIAPRFMVASDGPADGVLRWERNNDWKEGGESVKIRGVRLSSFAVLDRLRARISRSELYPNLSHIVIAGHSAGGQFVQRYALGTRAAVGTEPRLRFVVANPSSYMYLDARRPDGNGGFTAPAPRPGCLVNTYKYGAEGRNGYMAATPLAEMVRRTRARDVVYLIGARDSDTHSKSLDKSCPAMAQGPHRLARARNFMAYLDRFFSPHHHRLVMVPGVGHSSSRIFRSEAGLNAVFRR